MSDATSGTPSGLSSVRTFRAFAEIDPRRVLRTLWQRNWVIAVATALSMLTAWVLLMQVTPMYTAEAKVMIEGRKTRILDVQEILTNLQPQMATVMSEVEVLNSWTIARRVADKLYLYNAPDFNPTLAPEEGSRVFGALRTAMQDIRGFLRLERTPVELTPEERDYRIRQAVVGRVAAGLRVEAVRQSLVIRIIYRHKDPARAAQLANAYADAYIEEQLDSKFEAVRQATTWLNSRLSSLRDAVLASERAVETYRAEQGLIGTRGQLASQQKLTELNSQLVIAKSRRSEQEARVARVQVLLRAGRGLEAQDEVLASPLIQRLKEQEATLAREVAELASRYGDRHPLLQKGQTELAEIRQRIEAEINTQVSSLTNELAVLREREQSLAQEVREVEAAVLMQNEDEVKLRELEREAEANRVIYETFLARFKESGEQQEIQQADVRVISRAETPRAPSSPQKRLIMTMAILLGLVGGAALVLVLEHFDTTIRTRDQLESVLGLPALGMIPQIGRKATTGRIEDYLIDSPASGFAEAFRMLWFTLKHAQEGLTLEGKSARVVVVTSSLPDEGKSLTSLSLARTAAKMGIKVLLVDGDIRRSSIAKKLGLTSDKALIDVLAGTVSLQDAVITDPRSTLQVLPGRTVNLKELDLVSLANGAESLFANLRNHYDLIIVDSPPILPVADVQVLANAADLTVFCVRWDKTPRQTALTAIRMLQDIQATLAGVLLTRVDYSRHAGYGYQDAGYYYARYRSYYAD